MVDAVSRTVYEYQHLMDDTNVIEAVGKNETDRTINDEVRSHCWFDSVLLSLTSGTHTRSMWNPAPEALLDASSNHETSAETANQTKDTNDTDHQAERQFSDAMLWAKYLEAKSISEYLRNRGRRDASVVSNDSDGMNAVVSVCRAMTQQPLDLTSGPYPISKIEYTPFFPTRFSSKDGPNGSTSSSH